MALRIIKTTLLVLTSRPIAALLWVCVGFLLSLQAWGLTLFRGHFDPQPAESLGTWASAVMSFAAVSVALAGNYLTRLQYLTERQERADDQLTDLSAWAELAADDHNLPYWQVVFSNRTPYPIYSWTLKIEGLTEMASSTHGPLVPRENRFRLEGVSGSETRVSLPATFFFSDRKGRDWVVDSAGNKSLVPLAKES